MFVVGEEWNGTGPSGWNVREGLYENHPTRRGMPLGGLGSGGLSLQADGHFGESRLTRNWSRPLRGLDGCFFALRMAPAGDHPAEAWVLRRARRRVAVPHAGTVRGRFVYPCADLHFPDLPTPVELRAWSAIVPEDTDRASLPAAWFEIRLHNPLETPLSLSALMAFETPLGYARAAIGPLFWPHRLRGDWRRETRISAPDDMPGAIRMDCRPDLPRHDPRRRALGSLIFGCDDDEGHRSRCTGWDARQRRPAFWDAWLRNGDLPLDCTAGKPRRPAGAVSTRRLLDPGETARIAFTLSWHLPEYPLRRYWNLGRPVGRTAGRDVGSPASRFADAAQLHRQACEMRASAARDSDILPAYWLDPATCSLPQGLGLSVLASGAVPVTNTVLTADRQAFTIEGVDWNILDRPPWPFGRLTGAIDQQLAAHPWISIFFPDLARSELETFRRLARNGRVSRGNGNADVELGTTSVPYGQPIPWLNKGHGHWPDLTMAWILLAGLHIRQTGDRGWLAHIWPDLRRMAVWLEQRVRFGIPEGGSTWDLHPYGQGFLYHGSLYLATLRMLTTLTTALPPELESDAERLRHRWHEQEKRSRQAIDRRLWDERGFWRTADGRGTLFAGGLAGEWLARRAGLGGILDPERVDSHLRWQQKLLLEAPLAAARGDRLPQPWLEATPEGREVATRVGRLFPVRGLNYVWHQIAYQALPALQHGQTSHGLQLIGSITGKIWAEAYPFDAGMFGRPGHVFMSQSVLWGLPAALSGAWLDRLDGRLGFTLPPAGDDELRVPVCFPGLWLAVARSADTLSVRALPRPGTGVLPKPTHLRIEQGEGRVIEHPLPENWDHSGQTLRFDLRPR